MSGELGRGKSELNDRIGRIITRGRNSGLKCLSTGSLFSLSPPPPHTFPSLSSLFFPPNREPVHRLVGKQLRGHKMTPEFCESPRQIGELNVDRDKIIFFYISIMLNNTFLAPRNKMLQGRKIFPFGYRENKNKETCIKKTA